MVSDLNDRDEKDLSNLGSEKSLVLRSLSKVISEVTDGLAKLILMFLADYHKYFGKIFVYDGTVSLS